MQTNQGKAEYARAQQQASQIQTLAEAEAEKIRILGRGRGEEDPRARRGEADRAARVGIAQAMAIEEQVRAYGGPQFQLMQQVMSRFAEAIEKSRVDVVPKILIGGGGGDGDGKGGAMSGNIMETLLALLLSEKMGADLGGPSTPLPRNPSADALRSRIQKDSRRAGPRDQGLTGARSVAPGAQRLKRVLGGLSAIFRRVARAWSRPWLAAAACRPVCR